ncbi:PleD family two-component system response regulator [Paraburkholderia sp. IW21]|uniref:response regulator n=1 Tax=Paraburkholderia sp. IW21 TaxID=3242488 RepID=UPI00352244C3
MVVALLARCRNARHAMLTVLLVDDDLENRWALQLALESCGHHVLLAENGRDALQKAAREIPRLIITDWQMPEMDGAEMCRRLRCQPALANIPVVLLSALQEPEIGPRYWSAFLRKPASLNILMHTVDLFLAGRLTSAKLAPNCEEARPSRWRPVDSRCWP